MSREDRSRRLFQGLMRLLPAEFRRDYGREMERAFLDQHREASGHSGRERRLWLSTLADVLVTAPRQHLRILWQDLGFALRLYRKRPGIAVTAVVTLALGIGSATAVFSLVNQVLLRPLPYAEPDRLVYVYGQTRDDAGGGLSGPSYHDLRRQGRSFQALASVAGIGSATITGHGAPESIRRLIVSPGYFDLLGVPPALGRTFREDDLQILPREVLISSPTDGFPVAPMVISHDLWQRRFGGRDDVLGKIVRMDGRPKEIIGVMPAHFRVLLPPEHDADPKRDAWHLAHWDQELFPPETRFLVPLGRLRPGVSLDEARAEMAEFSRRQRRDHPVLEREGFEASVAALQPEVVKRARGGLWMLFGAVTFVLGIACANVASLLLAGVTSRHGELGLRVALGAGRERLLRQILTESLLLSLAGGALGLMGARAGLSVLAAIQPDRVTRFEQVHLDPAVVTFSLLASVLAAAAAGMVPAVRFSRPNLERVLRSGSRSLGGLLRHRGRGLLVAGQVALCFVLIVGTGLLLRSFVALHRVDPGFEPERLLGTVLQLPGRTYPDFPSRLVFYRAMQQRLEALPGVESVGFANEVPFDGDFDRQSLATEDHPDEERSLYMTRFTPGYLEALELPLRAGRLPGWQDLDRLEHPLAVIDEVAAQRLWPGEEAVGRRLRTQRLDLQGGDRVILESVWIEVVGVVAPVRNESLAHPLDGTVYVTYNLNLWGGTVAVLRTSVAPEGIVPSVREAVRELDDELALSPFWTLTDRMADSTAELRFTMTLLGCFGGIGLLLSAVGLYGLLSHSVRRGTGEIGLRIALGAAPSRVLALVLRQGLGLTLLGLAAGGIAAAGFGRLLSSQLFGVSAQDPVTFLVMMILVACTALAACALPAWRALRVDPLTALRSD